MFTREASSGIGIGSHFVEQTTNEQLKTPFSIYRSFILFLCYRGHDIHPVSD